MEHQCPSDVGRLCRHREAADRGGRKCRPVARGSLLPAGYHPFFEGRRRAHLRHQTTTRARRRRRRSEPAEDPRRLQRREETRSSAIDDVARAAPPRRHQLPELLLSNWAEADKPAELAQAWQVTHVFSCIEGTYLSREAAIERYAAAGITYDGVAAEDDEEYSMLPRHFARFRSFVAPLRRRREAGGAGRCLVHCAGGMNRSGVLAVAYAMESRRWPLLDAVAHCAGARGPILWNAGFQQELVDFARENDLLVERQQQRRHEEQEEMITR